MRHFGAWPWCDVPAGAVVLLDAVPRTVLVNDPIQWARPHDARMVLVEGLLMPPTIGGLSTVHVVELDETDAMLTLFAAGFTPESIGD